MGSLTVFSESGTPHSGCVLMYDGKVEWLSFMPRSSSFWDVFPGGNYGWIDTNDREDSIDTFVSLSVDNKILIKARNETLNNYYGQTYGLFIHDCISFSSDLAENCKLEIPAKPNFHPNTLVLGLFLLNSKKVMKYNAKPYPWSKSK